MFLQTIEGKWLECLMQVFFSLYAHAYNLKDKMIMHSSAVPTCPLKFNSYIYPLPNIIYFCAFVFLIFVYFLCISGDAGRPG